MEPAVYGGLTRTEWSIVQPRTIALRLLGRKFVHCRDRRPIVVRAQLALVELVEELVLAVPPVRTRGVQIIDCRLLNDVIVRKTRQQCFEWNGTPLD